VCVCVCVCVCMCMCVKNLYTADLLAAARSSAEVTTPNACVHVCVCDCVCVCWGGEGEEAARRFFFG